jgi:hypothetical protein
MFNFFLMNSSQTLGKVRVFLVDPSCSSKLILGSDYPSASFWEQFSLSRSSGAVKSHHESSVASQAFLQVLFQ